MSMNYCKLQLVRETNHTEDLRIKSPQDVAALLMDEMEGLAQEEFWVICLSTKNQVLATVSVSRGSLNASIVHPREVFKAAIVANSASVILAHNHPSGDPTPSQEDINVTRRLVEVGRLVGIDVLDHLVIGDGVFASLKDKGYV